MVTLCCLSALACIILMSSICSHMFSSVQTTVHYSVQLSSNNGSLLRSALFKHGFITLFSSVQSMVQYSVQLCSALSKQQFITLFSSVQTTVHYSVLLCSNNGSLLCSALFKQFITLFSSVQAMVHYSVQLCSNHGSLLCSALFKPWFITLCSSVQTRVHCSVLLLLCCMLLQWERSHMDLPSPSNPVLCFPHGSMDPVVQGSQVLFNCR